jgi:phenylacetate-CoA ligase
MSYGSDVSQRVFYRAPSAVKNLFASIYGWVERRRRYRAYYRHWFDHLERSQWWNNEELGRFQLLSTRRFLNHAAKHSRYYAELFEKQKFDPTKVSDVAELAVLPILTKPLLRSELGCITSCAFSKREIREATTSGTTGLGLRFPETWKCFEREYAFRFHNYHCAGIELGDRWAFCAGHPVTSPTRTSSPFWVHDYANRWLLMSSCHLTEANLKAYIDELERFRPNLIGGYPSSVYMLALANEHYGGRVRPRAIFTASETLLDFQRETIERSFRCKAYTYYGNAERCAFIAECNQGRLHVKLDHSLVEFLGEEGEQAPAGMPARMVCTGFGNYATPLVRYDIGDVAVVSRDQTCPCGRGGTILDELTGRVEDYVVTPDGRFVGRLDHLFKGARTVKMAQIVQQDVRQLTIRIMREAAYDETDESKILKEARLRLGPEIEINFDYTNEIPRTQTGKFPFVVSKIPRQRLFGHRLNAAVCDTREAEVTA